MLRFDNVVFNEYYYYYYFMLCAAQYSVHHVPSQSVGCFYICCITSDTTQLVSLSPWITVTALFSPAFVGCC